MKQAVIYARSASPNEDSIRTQIALGKKFAANNGYTVIKVFADTNASGRSIERPALQKLFEDISSSWDTVIVLNRSRFFREPYLYIKYINRLPTSREMNCKTTFSALWARTSTARQKSSHSC